MRLLEITDLTHEFVGKSIFNKASVMIQDSEHIGLVGPNGCGKTSLLKIILGEIVPDSWDFVTRGELKIGYLDQYADITTDQTVYDYLNAVFDELYRLDEQVTEIYATITELDEDAQLKAVTKAQHIIDRLDELEFDRIEKKIDNVLLGLGFTDDDRIKPICILSGGQKTKLILAKLLLQSNDLLILDEPTNFLDIKYITWLGDYLSRLKYSYIVISHDKAFLNKISNKIIEIANRKFKVYEGNYDYYVAEKKKREEMQLQQHTAQAKYIARSEEYVAGFEYGATIMNSKATWLKKMLTRLERIEKPDEIIKPEFNFKLLHGATEKIMDIQNIEIGYDNSPLLPPITLSVKRGEKIVFKGFNGIGKTTLLKSISGDIPLISGDIEFGEGIVNVFLKQEEDYDNNFSSFNKHERKHLGIKKGRQREITVIEFIKEYFPEKPQGELQKAMFSCGLNEVHFFNRVRSLSGGEMTKLRLCIAMMNPINLIILDEPTNHLDVYSKDVLLRALDDYKGTVLMTTHDINADISWATSVINLEELF